MPLTWPAKDPDEVLDYSWVAGIDAGDAIATATLTLADGSVVIDSQQPTATGLIAFLSGGTDGETNQFLARATTTGGRTFEETIYLAVVSSDSVFYGQFTAAFPAFASVGGASVAFWKSQAALIIDPLADCLGDRASLAMMLATAHLLCQNGLGSGTEAQMAAEGMGGFTRIKSGTLELERGSGSTSGGDWASTSYGQRLWPMIKGCVAGPRVTGTGSVCVGGFNGWAGPLPGYYR